MHTFSKMYETRPPSVFWFALGDVRPELPYEELFLRNLTHCDDKKPVWIYLPREPDYSKHKRLDEADPECEAVEDEAEEKPQSEAGESEGMTVDSEYLYVTDEEVLEEVVEPDDERKSIVSVPSTR